MQTDPITGHQATRLRSGLAVGLLGALALAAGAVIAEEREDNYTFWREEAARFGLNGAKLRQPNAGENEQRLRIRVTPRKPAPRTEHAGGGAFVCVRTCDGYNFPVGVGRADLSIAEYICKTSCPGAPVKVFTRRPGADLRDAVAADRKTTYGSLAAALAYQTKAVDSCACRPPSVTAASGPVFDDPTLRKGDMIVLEDRKVVVFKGDSRRPYTEEDDFVAIERAGFVPQAIRRNVDALFAAKRFAVAAKARGPGEGRANRARSLVVQVDSADDIPAVTAYAPIERRRPTVRIVLPDPFKPYVANAPLDLAAAARSAAQTPPAGHAPAER